MTSLIVDASVAVKWFVEEPLRAEARELIVGTDMLLAPELVIAEVGNALWKRCRREQLTEMDALEIVDEIEGTFAGLTPVSVLARRAMQHSVRLDHPIYDCFYIALAEIEAAPIVTVDRRLLRLAEKVPGVDIRPLAA
jgi:predicted nucleic acid-binding protein